MTEAHPGAELGPGDEAPAPPRGADPPPDDEGGVEAPCPNCGAPMNTIRGSKLAICRNCGFKDSCCY